MAQQRHLSHLCEKKQSGFTLIELLIAMAVSAIVAVLAYQTIATMVLSEEKITQNQTQMQKMQRAIWWLEQDVIQMTPRAVNDGRNGYLPALSYRQDLGFELTRIASYMSLTSSGGLVRVGYALQDKVLQRRVWPVVDRAVDSEPTIMPIMENLSSFEIRLLDQSGQWQQSWPLASAEQTDQPFAALQSLPKAIEFRFRFENGEQLTRLIRGVDGVVTEFNRPVENANAP